MQWMHKNSHPFNIITNLCSCNSFSLKYEDRTDNLVWASWHCRSAFILSAILLSISRRTHSSCSANLHCYFQQGTCQFLANYHTQMHGTLVVLKWEQTGVITKHKQSLGIYLHTHPFAIYCGVLFNPLK